MFAGNNPVPALLDREYFLIGMSEFEYLKRANSVEPERGQLLSAEKPLSIEYDRTLSLLQWIQP